MRATLEAWRDGLLDLTGANPLIDVRTTATGVVEVVSPSPRSIVEALQQGRECGFLGIEEQAEGPRPRASHVFQTAMADAEMDATLRALLQASHRDLLEQGVSTLYLGLGTVRWTDAGNEHISPILLIPVDLVTPDPQDYPRLRARAEDPIVNPALDICLRRHNIELPAVDSLAALDVTVFWARLDAALGDHPDWHSDEAVLLARFAVHREVMYTDLLDHERRVVSHPVIRALATEPEAQPDAFKFEVVAGRRIDEIATPDDVPLILDADAAQRACVTAALHGRTFVMRGAPGTGKSQTIANMIGGLLHAGRRVLLVAEKAAALDTVLSRLEPTGLHDYLLELHSGRTGRDQVAATLAAALDFIPLPPPDLSTDEREALREHRQRLNAYAEAMNEVREPLGHRLHDVLGMCAQMTDVAQAPAPAELPIPLTTQSLQRVRDAAERLARAWRPAREGEDFLWRDVIDRNRLDARLHQAQSALDHLVEAIERDPLAEAFLVGSIGEAITVTTMVGHGTRRPPEAADEWLTMSSLEPVARAAEGLLRHLKSLHQAEDAVRAKAGVTWSSLPSPGKLPIIPSLAHLKPPAVELLPLTAAQARGLARRFADEADRIEQHQHSLDRVTARLGLPNVVAFTDLARLAAIVDLLSRPDKPEPGWFDSMGTHAAHAAMRNLRRVVNVVKATETRAREHFSENALAEPVDQLAQRFAHQHKGIAKLRAPYRRDKKAAAEIARPDVSRSQAVANLDAAAAWKRALEELDDAEREYAGILGRHWQRLNTDFEAIERALHTAEETLRVTPPEALPSLIERICAPTPNSAIIRIVGEAGKEFERWTAALRPAPEPAPRPALATGPIHDAVTWLRAHVEPFTAVAELVQAYSAAAGRDFTLAEAAAIGLLRESASEAASALSSNAREYARVLGNAYRGTQTDVEALAAAMAWTSETRRIRNGADIAFNAEQAELLGRARPSDTLPARVAEWQSARDWILRAFAPSRHPALSTALDERETARELLRELLEDNRGQQEWFDYQAARVVLAEHGLDAVVDFCAREDLPVEQILPVLGRSLFQSWADTIIREDDRLAPLDASGRDRLVDEFRLWDSRLQRAAAAEVMNAVDALQPAEAAAGEAALLRASAAYGGRRLPVRELFARTAHAAMAVKPCLVMSPADVSRLLPADLHFDVVIIDEASRVPVPDALTCAYRGNALVVCGDDRQLPAVPIPGGDPRSILDLAVSCGAFRILDLATHYRSRDESLIAFANHAFYKGQLNTFPAFAPPGPDRGVQLYPATGEMAMAELVATRVAHHLVTRPELSLGVVVCTADDAYDVEVAVADMVVPPEGDRLRGFFVKNLDAVQGDERDVVIFAIGSELGSLEGRDGWRRLNVATTRARRRLEVISAVRARELSETDESLRHLAHFLDYAARGIPALALEEPETAESQTPFEDSVRDVISGWGYRVQSRVGTGAFRIDLAVRRSARRNAPFALGIECDGTSYDSAPTARDRDRIREQVLDGLGWKLHRVWGTAWYLDREREETRLRAAIEDAFAELPDEEVPELAVGEAAAQVSTAPSGAAGEPIAEAAEGYVAGYRTAASQPQIKTDSPYDVSAAHASASTADASAVHVSAAHASVSAVHASTGAAQPSASPAHASPAHAGAADISAVHAAAAHPGRHAEHAEREPLSADELAAAVAGTPAAFTRVGEVGGAFTGSASTTETFAEPARSAEPFQPAQFAQPAQSAAPFATPAAEASGTPATFVDPEILAQERAFAWTDADDIGLAEVEAAAEADLAAAHDRDDHHLTVADSDHDELYFAEIVEEHAPTAEHGAVEPDTAAHRATEHRVTEHHATEHRVTEHGTAEHGATEHPAPAEHGTLAGIAAQFAFAQAGAEELAAAEAYLGANLETTIAQLQTDQGLTTARTDQGDVTAAWAAEADLTGIATGPAQYADPSVQDTGRPIESHEDAAQIGWPSASEDTETRADWPFASRAEDAERVDWPTTSGGAQVEAVEWPSADQESRVREVTWPTATRAGAAEDATTIQAEAAAQHATAVEAGIGTQGKIFAQDETGEWDEDESDWPATTAVTGERQVSAVQWPAASRDDQSELARRLGAPAESRPAKARPEPTERRVSSIEWPSAARDETATPGDWQSATTEADADWPAESGHMASEVDWPAEPEHTVSAVEWPVAARATDSAASQDDLAEVAARFGVGTEELAAAAAQFLAGLDETSEPADRLGAITQIRAELTGEINLDPHLADAAAAVAQQSVLAGESVPRHDWYQEMGELPGVAASSAEFEETMAAPPGWTGSEVFAATETEAEPVAHTDEWLHPYRKADLAPLPAGAVLTDPALRTELTEAVRRLAEIEGPVHISIALQRMREEWGLARITRPARAAIEAVIEEAGVAWDGTFLGDPDQMIPLVRHRADGVARKADQVSDAELAIACENLVIDSGVLPVDDLLAAVTRLYGWAPRRSSELDARITGLLADLVAEGNLLQQPNGLAAAHGLPDAIQLPRHDSARHHAHHPSPR